MNALLIDELIGMTPSWAETICIGLPFGIFVTLL